jgi:hypothetical protein
MKRKKRLEKGIESIKEQIELHKAKLKKAEEEGQEELMDYYYKELNNLVKQKEQKEYKLNR